VHPAASSRAAACVSTRCLTLQRTSLHTLTLQHTAQHCNTRQHLHTEQPVRAQQQLSELFKDKRVLQHRLAALEKSEQEALTSAERQRRLSDKVFFLVV